MSPHGHGQNARTTGGAGILPAASLGNARLCLKLTAWVALALPAFAPLASAAPPECRVRALVLQAGATSEQLHAHAEAGTATAGVVTVKTFLNHEYDTLKLKSPKLVFTAKPDPASAKDVAARIGTCEIPAAAKSVILLFITETPGQPACKIVVVDDSAKAFPAGSFAIVNRSALPVKIQLEDQSFEFKPGEIRAIPNPPVGPSQASAMKGFCKRAGEWENFASGVWPHPGDKRVLQILTDNPTTNQVEIRGVRDVAKP
jgi:hypothetical protein